MINYVYVWFANFRLRFLGCLDWNICFTQIFFSILISVWSFQCTIWLNVYQSSEASTLWILWSLVKPVILFLIWQPPAFPYRHQYSIIGRFRLNHRVRDVDGCFPKAYRHQKYDVIYSGLSLVLINNSTVNNLYSISLERRWSSRTFRYGYLVTTSPQLSVPPSAAPSLRLGHWLRALPTPMVWRAVCTRPGNVFTAAFWSAITSDSSFV